MGFTLRTLHNHSFYDIASMLQKAIRRGDIDHAGYAANELFGNYKNYLWKRLLVISAEDCYGIMTKEIVALQQADEIVNKGRKGYDCDMIFVSKAIVLLIQARKNRDACYFACNFMDFNRTIPEDKIEHVDLSQCKLIGGIPEWVYDIHTLKGKQMGKTDLDMTIDEQRALNPHQIGLFDDGNWANYYKQALEVGIITEEEYKKYLEFAEGKKLIP